MTTERKPPYSLEAEQALIGSVLLDPSVLDTLDVGADEFFNDRHRDIWQSIYALHRERITPDYVTLVEHLERTGRGQNIVDNGYLLACLNATPTAIHAALYAEVVREKATRRRLIALAGEMAGAAYDADTDIETQRGAWLTELVMHARLRGHAGPVSDYSAQLEGEVAERMAHPTKIYGIPTGFRDFDRITKGLHRGEVFLLAGQPGKGKSLFAGQSALQMTQAGRAGVYYALEMRGVAIVRRMLSALTRITTGKMRSGYVTPDEFALVHATAAHIAKLPLYLSDDTRWTTLTLRADLARLKASAGIEWCVVDHVGLLKDANKDPNERDKQISQALHDIAKDLDLAVLAIHTMNKVGLRNAGQPTLADASGSFRWLFDADVVAFLTDHIPDVSRGESPQDQLVTLTFAKYREDSPDRYMHLVKLMADEGGQMRGLPKFGDYSGGQL